MVEEVVLKGLMNWVAVRKLSEAATKNATWVPKLTSTDFDPSRDSDTTATKSGNVATLGEIETDFSFELLYTNSPVIDLLYQAFLNKTKLEFWDTLLDKKNDENQAYANYMRGYVTEFSKSGDADDNATVEITVTVEGDPKPGYLTVPDDVQKKIDYAFRGLQKTQSDPTGGGKADKEVETPQAESTER